MAYKLEHKHSYEHNPLDSTYARCATCGFTTPARLILSYSMVLDSQLSAGLLAERQAIEAERIRTIPERLAARLAERAAKSA